MRRLVVLSAVLCAFVLEGANGTAASGDIVLYASDISTIQGNWSRPSTSGAAGGTSLSSTDRSWSTANAPLAAPSDFFEATFTATANTSYHVWLRMRASGNSKWNESVWVQFGDAIDASGAAVYRTGSTSGLLVNLENCSGCGVAGWGWQDKAYWLAQSTKVRFPSSGAHTIRIQTREDGVQVDQIVLSPSTYMSSAPGQLTNDATIVPKPPVAGSPTPFSGTPAAVPGTIQNEDFDNGGAGVAYGDGSAGNSGGQYRQTDVDIERAASGGYDVGWVSAGEWLKYTVNVASAGQYTIAFRVASLAQGGTFHLEMNGTNVTGALRVPTTGGWQNWQTLSATATLTAGVQVARLVMDSVGASAVGNFDWMQFTKASSGSAPGAPAAPNPASGATGVATTPTLSWSASGATSYDVRFGTTNPPAAVASNTTTSSYTPSGLTSATKYYWQIVAKNSSGSTTGAVWSFTTATAPPPPPSPPGVPTSPSVANGATGVTLNPNLSWTASGATSYDVRFGILNPPPALLSNITAALYVPTTLLPGIKYYWQVVAKNSAGSTTGPVWSFTTGLSTSAPRLVVFQKSADDATGVTSYLLEVFANGANPDTATPIASSNLGKPAADANGDITVDRSSFFSALAPGTYLASVSAIGNSGSSRGTPVTFSR